MRDLVFKRREVFDIKNQKKGYVEEKLNLIIGRKLILMANNSKFRVKINEGEPTIMIFDSRVEMNVITCKVANRFNLIIK